MNNRALIGLSAAAMSALVATAVGCGEPQQKTYTPAEEPAATVEAPATTEAETTETEAAEPEATEAEKAEETTEAEGDKAEEAAPAEETTEAEAEAEKTDEAPASDAAYTDGEYTAEGKGIGGTVPVTVTVKDGKVAEVTVGDNSETQGIGSKAIEQLPDAIVAANGTEGVDAVSGATVTSKAIFTAVDEALAQAQGGAEAAEQSEEAAPAADDAKAEETAEPAAEEKADEKAEPAADEKAEEAAPAAEAGALTDGSYTAEGKGIGGKVPVTVEVKDGKVATVTVGDNSETQGIGSKAIEQLPDAIVAANGTEGVDAVSGATVTSKAIFSAVEDCLEQAKGGAAEQAAPAEADKAEEKAEPAAEETKADEKADKAEDAKADEKAEEPAVDEKAEPAADEKAEEAAPAEAGALTDGSYTAEGKGIGGKVPVTVEVKDGKVATVTVGDNSETQGIGSKAIEQLPDAIVAANGTEGVDAVSGATVTSKAIFTAVEDCLEQAKGGAAEQAAPAEADKAEEKAEPAAEEKADEKAEDAKADEKADDKAADAKDEKAADDTKAEEKAEEAAPAAEAGALTDGSYTAEGKGIGGKVPVTVEVKDGKVATVTVGDNSETQGIGSKAIEQLPAKIVEANGTEGVDAVSGATVTSKAIFTAVEDCLEQAKGGAAEQAAPAEADKAEEPAAEEKAEDAKADDKAEDAKADEKAEPAAEEKAEDAKADEKAEPAAEEKAADTKDAKADDKAADTKDEKAADTKDAKADEKADDKKADEKDAKDDKAAEGYADGEYTAEGKGIGGTVPVTVTVKDGKVSDVKVGDNSETQGIGSKAIEQLPAKIVEANGLEGVDAVSGATVTSKAIFTAVEDCLKQAAPAADAKADKAEAGALKDGDYTAEGKGIGGKVPVTVTVKDGKIAEVTVGDNSETQGIGSKAIEQLPAKIVEANGLEGVDAVSGATVTSKAIFTAVEDCLEQAK